MGPTIHRVRYTYRSSNYAQFMPKTSQKAYILHSWKSTICMVNGSHLNLRRHVYVKPSTRPMSSDPVEVLHMVRPQPGGPRSQTNHLQGHRLGTFNGFTLSFTVCGGLLRRPSAGLEPVHVLKLGTPGFTPGAPAGAACLPVASKSQDNTRVYIVQFPLALEKRGTAAIIRKY